MPIMVTTTQDAECDKCNKPILEGQLVRVVNRGIARVSPRGSGQLDIWTDEDAPEQREAWVQHDRCGE